MRVIYSSNVSFAVTSDIQVTCFSGVGCDISGASLVVPDIPTCCLMSGERSYVLSGSQACQTCVGTNVYLLLVVETNK